MLPTVRATTVPWWPGRLVLWPYPVMTLTYVNLSCGLLPCSTAKSGGKSVFFFMPAPSNLHAAVTTRGAASRLTMESQNNFVQLEHFQGLPTEDGERWLERYEHFCVFKALTDAKQLVLLPCLLKQEAWDWFLSQPDNVKNTLPALKQAFKTQYARKQQPGEYAAKLFSSKQMPGQRVADFVVTIRRLAQQAHLDDTRALQAALHGLNPAIKPFVSRDPPTSLDGLVKEAEAVKEAQKLEETPTAALADAAHQLTKEIEYLKLPQVQVADTQRRVQFRNRSPATDRFRSPSQQYRSPSRGDRYSSRPRSPSPYSARTQTFRQS